MNKTQTVSKRTGRLPSASSDEDNSDDEDVNIETIQTVNDKDNLMSCLRSANLKDYSNLSTNNYLSLESSSYAKIYSHDGSVRLFKKSSIVWLLESGVKKLSNDRRLRVMQSVSFTEQNKHIITKVETRKTIQLGDYCVFQRLNRKNFLIGRVLSFALAGNYKKSGAMWEWKVDDKNIGKCSVLCYWFKAEEVQNNLTGNLIECDVSIPGFYSCDNYVCSLPDPCRNLDNLYLDSKTSKTLTEKLRKLHYL